MSTGLAVAGVRGHARRLVATALAIVLGVGFVTASLGLLGAAERGIERAVAGPYQGRDLAVLPGETGSPTAADVDTLRDLEGVTVAGAAMRVYGERPGGEMMRLSTAVPGDGAVLVQGRLPDAGEHAVALGTLSAEASGSAPGDVLSFTPWGESDTPTVELPVVGVVDLSADPSLGGIETALAPEAVLRDLGTEPEVDTLVLDVEGGADAAADRVRSVLPGMLVVPADEAARMAVSALTGGTDVLAGVVLGFGAVALTTSAIVIATTFGILLAQRTRELALLRCIGATRGQLRRSVLTEAAVVGAAAATLGVLGGLGTALAVGSAVGEVSVGGGMRLSLVAGVDPLPVALPWAVGVVMTVLAAWWPTRRATLVAPVEALRPADAQAGSRGGRLRLVAGLLGVAGGAAALVLAAADRSVPVGVAGGLLSFAGVLLLGVYAVPPAVRGFGVLLRPTGLVGELAVDNAVREPRRAAATTSALLLGVTLITMTGVGAASAERTADEEIASQYPVDVVVTRPVVEGAAVDGEAEAGLSEAHLRDLAEVPGVDVVVPLDAAQVTVTVGDLTWTEPGYAVDPESAAPAFRDTSGPARLAPGTVGYGADVLTSNGLEPGMEVEVIGPSGSTTATLVEFGLGWDLVVHPGVLADVAGPAPVGGALLRLSDDADVPAVMAGVESAVEGLAATVEGAAALRSQLSGILRVLVLVTTALLGVGVVIAVIGIANTLSLSVLERVREHALLRALGLTRGQVRGVLAAEGVLFALVATAVGLGLGSAYAWFGVQSLLPDGTTVRFAVPWAQVAAVGGVAVLAGLVASVGPARRAVRVPPAHGLAAT